MLKRLSVALAALFAFVPTAQGAGTVPGFSLVPQFDLTGKVMPGCKLYIIQAGTVSTPQNAYQDSGLTLLFPNPLSCDAAGRLPQWFVADGSIKVRLTSSTGVQAFVQDNLLVIGASSGGGGGSPVDPTTILATGDFKLQYNTGPITGFVRCNGRTIGSATSGATERANADTSALYAFLWGVDANLAVTGGRGVSGAADFSANKPMALPDCRGRGLAGLDDMGNSAAGRLTSTYFGSAATTLGVAGGAQNVTLLTSNLPPYTPVGTITNGAITSMTNNVSSGTGGGTLNMSTGGFSGTGTFTFGTSGFSIAQSASTFTGTAAPGQTSTPLSTVQPTILTSIYIKL